MSEESFDQWAIVELMGHQRIAGRVTEQQLGGTAFVRVDVPDVNDERPGFTRLLGNGAIYAINIVTEDVARAAAKQFRAQPISAFEIPELRQHRLGVGEHDDDIEF